MTQPAKFVPDHITAFEPALTKAELGEMEASTSVVFIPLGRQYCVLSLRSGEPPVDAKRARVAPTEEHLEPPGDSIASLSSQTVRLELSEPDPGVWYWVNSPHSEEKSPLFNLDNLRSEIDTFVKEFGPAVDSLLDSAAKHFSSPTIRRRTDPLTPSELNSLIEDDEICLNE